MSNKNMLLQDNLPTQHTDPIRILPTSYRHLYTESSQKQQYLHLRQNHMDHHQATTRNTNKALI